LEHKTRLEQVPEQLRANILLVDDQPANLLVLRTVLEDLNENLVEAKSGEEAVRRSQETDFAVVLLDVQMPGLDGFEAARLIRASDKSRLTPIIFLTAYEDDRFSVERAYSLGAVDYLTKPVVAIVLKAKVAGFVELYKEKERARRAANQLRLLIEGTTEYAIFMLDPTGHIMTWNPGAERIKGYQADEIIGEHFSRFYPSEATERSFPEYELQVARSAGRFEDEGWRVRKNGTQFWANVVITALHDESGKLQGFSKITRDMTERKQAEENARRLLQEETARKSEQRFTRFMQNFPGLAWIKDWDGRYVYANDAAQKAFGKEAAQLYGHTDADLFPLETAAQFQENDQKARMSGTGVHVIETLQDDAGVIRHSVVSKFPIHEGNGGPVLIGEMAIDITDRLRAEEALRQADRRKDEFLATLAHELRNPLAPIRNSLQILKMPRVDASTVHQTRDMMERQVQQLVRLVDDLLDVSRVMRGKIDLRKERVELATIVARAVETTQPLIEAQGHVLQVDVPDESLLLDADPVRLIQVVGNLLTNSAKYTEANGSIQLTAERAGDQVLLRIRDTGIGIAPDMLPHVFELFVQADHAASRSQGGLGIGLTLVKNLVEMHEGSVEAYSEGLGKGSEFVVRLPLIAPVQSANNIKEEGLEPVTVSGHRLMVVDDNADAADSLALLLRLQGHEVKVAHNGPSALELAANYLPQMILLDIGMPGMDGYEVARRIRKRSGLEKVVLTALTGWGQQEDRRRSAEAGFDHHLVKPPEPKLLEELLSDLQSQKE
jgi:PAS domain S-box-containing protein